MQVPNIFSSNLLVFLAFGLLSIFHERCNASIERQCQFVSEGPKMCGGTPYFEQTVSTPGFCEMYRCETDPICKGFTFFVSDNRCALFENCNTDTLVDCIDDNACLTGLCSDVDFVNLKIADDYIKI